MGGYLDTIYMFEGNPAQAAQQIMDGTYDFFAGGITMAQMEALESSSILYDWDVKRQYELLINPVSTESTTGMINPFSSEKIRKALNTLLDRGHIADKIFAGGAVPKYQPLIYKSADYNQNEAAIEAITRTYQYDYDAAKAAIDAAMGDMGAVPDDAGKWAYKGEPVDIKILIRTDDERRVDIGEYVASQLESLGFTVTRQYVSFTESTTLWAVGDPREGQWHLYTGRRTLDSAPMNQQSAFADFYTPLGENADIDLYHYFTADEAFNAAASTLLDGQYESLEQRHELMAQLIAACNDFSYRIWLVDEFAYFPRSEKTIYQNTLTSRTDTDPATAFSLKKKARGAAKSLGRISRCWMTI